MRGPISLALAGTAASALQIPLLPNTLSWFGRHAASDSVSRPVVETEALQASIDIKHLQRRAEKLYEIAESSLPEMNHPTRVIGSKGHLGTIAYIKSVLAGLGDYYTVSEQIFPAVSGRVYEHRLVIGDHVPPSTAFGLTPPTKGKQPVYGDLVLVRGLGCDPSDYPKNSAGNVVVVRRGECPFGTKSELAGRAGASAAVVVSDEDGELHGTLGQPSPHHVATFGLSKGDGNKYIEALERGDKLDAIAYMDAEVTTTRTPNIIAVTRDGDADNCLALGGHSDSVAEGPGINDDGSGSLSVLEVAVQLAKFKVKNRVIFAWSNYFVDHLKAEENQKIRLFLDYDMMASPNFAYQIYNATNAENPAGSEELRDLYIGWYKSHGLNYTLIPFDGRSDYDGFIRHGIPAGGIATGAEGQKTPKEETMFGGKAGDWYDPNYHQIGDNLSNLNLTAWEVNTKLIAHSVATYASSFEGFPKRTSEFRTEAYASKVKYRGHKLFM
ncbi:hypothetical protein DCS_03519 [Drechmeria coniospora]|uniref:Peptide hydrolase n=1 Tax=Drechmeria coniospora TaxID=98403 RepID=A0A151GHH8_DRECN|nr:hypothetical protein DCS_03519 [Drechmeria coniospora]KYK56519.1 hypothetical protein DCS_03519 [Drechmeria coniospora]